ncbi:MAG: glycosyltransferase [Bacteroidales bacterium]|nr:glycosyltransferase [Bacteroidales bacterium]
MYSLTTIINNIAKTLGFKRRMFIQTQCSAKTNQTICYTITVCDEHEELSNILNLIVKHIRKEDEILVQCDKDNTTQEVRQVIAQFENIITKVVEHPLLGDYGQFKNNLIANTSCDFLFQLDADELPSPYLLEKLPEIISQNPDIELFKIPRLNVMINNEESFMTWDSVPTINQKDLINFPDYQKRLFKHSKDIFWTKKIHELVVGYKTWCYLPKDNDFCILHCKKWAKQQKRWDK